ncbi:MAG: hypothetical protein HKN21_14270 [Candidatus Eisenbacteria bacterium]|uniref:PH domain-containing protein n=1 Tax=Eiseniibacteriota bacterium TaxID=2212470 RepID=A0A7Y2H3D1_UNCEI|nr:hypothetical protein [Candidatus Eisenbacteria bacterium]
MKANTTLAPNPVILEAEAHSFGVGVWEPGKRGKGKLTLSTETLRFVPERGNPVEILLGDIDTLSQTSRHSPRANSVLRVTYQGNLVLGLTVEDAETWINAIQALSGPKMEKPQPKPNPVASRFEIQRFRLVVGMFLLLIVLMSTALPLFFTWMQARVNTPADTTIHEPVPTGAF